MIYTILDWLFVLTIAIAISLFFSKLTHVMFKEKRIKFIPIFSYQIIISICCITALYIIQTTLSLAEYSWHWTYHFSKITVYILTLAIVVVLSIKNFERLDSKKVTAGNNSSIHFFGIQSKNNSPVDTSKTCPTNCHSETNKQKSNEYNYSSDNTTNVKVDNFKNTTKLKSLIILENSSSQSERTLGKLDNVVDYQSQDTTLSGDNTYCSSKKVEVKQKNTLNEIGLWASNSDNTTFIAHDESISTPFENESDNNENLNITNHSINTDIVEEKNHKDIIQIDWEHYNPAIEAFKTDKREIAKNLIEYLINETIIDHKGNFNGFTLTSTRKIEFVALILTLDFFHFLIPTSQIALIQKFECLGIKVSKSYYNRFNEQIKNACVLDNLKLPLEEVSKHLNNIENIDININKITFRKRGNSPQKIDM
ncbi:hypothetical protein [uncultured Dokdonia sp.]|uniref:hypothetical protein n=1 Tax=uncultured Dokdonia sp. TaxID=575653 RepID=UPI0030EEAB61|tara:strand:+ start:1593 stop:2864 length:1272 start_codon:yes stop_codon:yes gene_type:complete